MQAVGFILALSLPLRKEKNFQVGPQNYIWLNWKTNLLNSSLLGMKSDIKVNGNCMWC